MFHRNSWERAVNDVGLGQPQIFTTEQQVSDYIQSQISKLVFIASRRLKN